MTSKDFISLWQWAPKDGVLALLKLVALLSPCGKLFLVLFGSVVAFARNQSEENSWWAKSPAGTSETR
eukprot:4941588-Amphidinium_carterae.1